VNLNNYKVDLMKIHTITSKSQLDYIAKKISKTHSKVSSTLDFLKQILLVSELCFSIKEKQLLQVSYQNYITNVISALEVYFKDVVLENAGYWNAKGFDNLLKEKK
jgi:hypothetical protein